MSALPLMLTVATVDSHLKIFQSLINYFTKVKTHNSTQFHHTKSFVLGASLLIFTHFMLYNQQIQYLLFHKHSKK